MLLGGCLGELGIPPHVRGQEAVGFGDSVEGALGKVTTRLGVALGSSVAILDTGL